MALKQQLTEAIERNNVLARRNYALSRAARVMVDSYREHAVTQRCRQCTAAWEQLAAEVESQNIARDDAMELTVNRADEADARVVNNLEAK